jgi:hypothetical protein
MALFADPGRLFACAVVRYGTQRQVTPLGLDTRTGLLPLPPAQMGNAELGAASLTGIPWHSIGSSELSPAEYRYQLKVKRRAVTRSMPLVPWTSSVSPGPGTSSLRDQSLYLSMR